MQTSEPFCLYEYCEFGHTTLFTCVCMYVFICLFAYYIGSMQFQMQLWKTSSNRSCAHAQQMLAHRDPGLSLALKPSNPYMSN